MRKSIFDIVKDNTNLANDVLRLDSMFLKDEILRVNRGIPYTLKDYVEDYCFETWKYRNHCLDVDDFLRTVNYNNLKRSATINAEDIFTLIEIIYNFWNLAFGDLEKGTNGLLWSGNFFHLQDVMDDILRQYNYTAYIPEDDECVLVIEDKPEVTATAEIVPETLALDIIRYNHRLLKGNINAKKSILLKLASELEPRRKELQELDKDLTSNIFFMLNNMNIRHNNQNINEPSKYKKYVPKTGRNKGNTYEQFYKGENFRLFAWLKDVAEEINGILYKKDLQGTLWDFVGETKNLTKEGDVPFPNGKKPVRLLKQMLTMLTSGNDYVLDFFSGSSTTAHAVMQLNAEDDGHRKFIMVQLPEKTDEKSEAYKAGYKNICEIGKERIRRAGRKIKEDAGLTAPADLDIGFRCLRLDESNMKPVYYTPEETQQQDLFSLVDNVKSDRTPEDLLFQVMLDLGVLLSSPIEVKEIAGKKVFNVAEGFLLACFDHDVTEETVKAIAQMKPYYAVFRDSSMANDSVATNFDQIFETYSPETVRKVL